MQLRTEEIDGKPVYIVDDYLDREEINSFYDFALSLNYARTEKSVKDDDYPKYVVNFDPDKFVNGTYLGRKGHELFQKFYENTENYKLFRAYINLSNYGDVEWPHRDCPKGRGDITILFYINKVWHYKYGGETLFYQNKEPLISVLPKPGRIVLFEGDIEHIGGLPNRICKLSRYSLAVKYSKYELEK